MKVVLVNGSPHKKGNTKKALQLVEEELIKNDIEISYIEIGNKPVIGCQECEWCQNKYHCVHNDDVCNQIIDEIANSDGIIIGTPVYFAGPNGALCSILDRVFYAGSCHGRLFKNKLAASVATVWREGASCALDRINKYFTYSEMTLVSSTYWNVYMGDNDYFGKNTLKELGINFAKLLKERVM
mgnify:CR=1 FL=1